jgi:hypothetical protein
MFPSSRLRLLPNDHRDGVLYVLWWASAGPGRNSSLPSVRYCMIIVMSQSIEQLAYESMLTMGSCGPKEVYEHLQTRGVHNSYSNVQRAMQHLMAARRIERVATGRYEIADKERER